MPSEVSPPISAGETTGGKEPVPPGPSPPIPAPCPPPGPDIDIPLGCPGEKENGLILSLAKGRVSLFSFNAEGKENLSLFDSELNPIWLETIPDSEPLPVNQRELLRDALCHKEGATESAPCYFPRHAFLFYEEGGEPNNPSACLEVCLECNNAKFFYPGKDIKDIEMDFSLLSTLIEIAGDSIVDLLDE